MCSMNDQEKAAPEFQTTSFDHKSLHYRVSRLLGGAMGLLLLTASVMKAADVQIFVAQIKAYAIIAGPSLIPLIAWCFITLQWVLGVGLLIFYHPRGLLPLTALHWLFLLGVTAWAWATGVTQECGCYGAWVSQRPGTATLENLAFLFITILAWKYCPTAGTFKGRTRGMIMAAALAVGLALPLLSGIPPVFKEPVAAMDFPGDMDRDIRIPGPEQIDLKKGAYLLFLMATDCPHCQEVLPEVDTLAETRELPRLIALTRGGDSGTERFIREFRPPYPLGRVREKIFWRLLGASELPRFFLVRDGRVLKVWDSKVPTVEEVAGALTATSP